MTFLFVEKNRISILPSLITFTWVSLHNHTHNHLLFHIHNHFPFHNHIHNHFLFHNLVDSVAEHEEGTNLILIQDNEKCLTFYADNSTTISNDKNVEDWFKEITKCIEEMHNKQRICGVCNEFCFIHNDLQKEINSISWQNSKISLQSHSSEKSLEKNDLRAVMCQGCGRIICEKCMVDMRCDPIQDAVDKTVYCLHCRNWNKKNWSGNMRNCKYNPNGNASQTESEWKRIVNASDRSEYWFNEKTNGISWRNPEEHESDSFGFVSDYENENAMGENTNNRWISYISADGKSYYYNPNTNQTQWKQTIDPKEQLICLHCGMTTKSWDVVCPKCNHRWSM